MEGRFLQPLRLSLVAVAFGEAAEAKRFRDSRGKPAFPKDVGNK